MTRIPAGQSLRSLLASLEERGDRAALLALHEEGVERVSARNLARVATRLAWGLSRSGIRRGDAVALFAANRSEWIVACLGVMAAGAVVMPLDVQFPDEALQHALKDGDPKLVLTDRARAERLERLDVERERRLLDVARGAQGWRSLLERTGQLPRLEPRDLAALFYTSGTTGPPKGVPLTHANLASQIVALREAGIVGEHDRLLLPLPLHHVYPFVLGMLAPLELGVPIVLPRAMTGPEIVRAVRECDATVLVGVPRLYSALVDGIEARAAAGGRLGHAAFRAALAASTALRSVGIRAGRRLFAPVHAGMGSSLRLLASGGAPLSEDLERKLGALGWEVGVGYGLTETSPLVTLRPPRDGAPGSVGRPMTAVELRLDHDAAPGDGDRGADARGTHGDGVGEVQVRGPNVFGGYHRLPDATAEAFTADGWFRTGDLGRLDGDGYLHLAGRSSEMIVTESGKNVQPEHVEDAYLQHPALREIGVFQMGRRLAAIVVPEPRALRDADDAGALVERALSERGKRLPSYQRVSEFAITREALERTRLGKLRRHRLEERFEQARRGEQRAAGPMPIADMGSDDQALLDRPAARAVWDLLAERYARVPLTPDSALDMDLGIDSLEWVNLTLDVSQRAGVELREEAIAGADTVRDLLGAAADAGEGEAPDLAEDPERSLDEGQKRWLSELSRPARAAAAALYALDRILMRTVFRIEVHGASHLEGMEALVLAPNHTSYLDPLALAAAHDPKRSRDLYWGGWVGAAFGHPLLRLVSRLAQAVPVDPKRGPVSSLAFAAAVLKRGKRLVWFPEGARSPDGTLQALKPGIAMLLEAQDVPVAPVHISGTHDAMPVGRLLPRPRRLQVRFGRPVRRTTLLREGEGDDPRAKVLDALERRIRALAGEAQSA